MSEIWKLTPVRDLKVGDTIEVGEAGETVTSHEQVGDRDWYRYGVTGNGMRSWSGSAKVMKLYK